MKEKAEKTEKKETKPFDRKDVFILAFRKHYPTILGVSVAMLIFALPAIAVFFGSYIEFYYLGGTSAENAMELYSIQTRMYLWLIPAFMILSVGAAGSFYVIRRMVWGEEGPFFKDFFRGIKNNWWQSIIVGTIFILFVGALNYGMNMLVLNASLGSFYWVLYMVQIFLSVISLMLLLFQYSAIAVYNDNVFKIIKNSFALVWMSLPRSILILILAFLPVFLFLTFVKVYIIYVIVIVFLALVGFGYGILLFTLHTHYVFDRYINRDSFPEIYKKGLYHEGNTSVGDKVSQINEGSNMDVE